MMSKRFLLLLIIIATCSLIASFVLPKRNTGRVVANSQSKKFPVYFANFEEYVAAAGKTPTLSRKVLRAQRSDGTLVEIEDKFSLNGNGQYYTTRNIYRSDRTLVILRDKERIGYATANGAADPQTDMNRYDPSKQCKVTYAGVADFKAAPELESLTNFDLKATRLESDSAGVRHQIWRVPSVDCLQVRRMSEFKGQDGIITDTSEYKLVNLQLIEPPVELFSVPLDYESVTPTQFYERLMPLFGTSMSESSRIMLAPAEADYAKNRIPLSALK
jgi:hypothetical protein